MSNPDVKKTPPYKPPVPARPKNLVVFNSKYLPKPPENLSPEKVTRFIKNLNLDKQGEKSNSTQVGGKPKERFSITGSDIEEDVDGYLEPISIPVSNSTDSSVPKCNSSQLPNERKKDSDITSKLSDVLKKSISKINGSNSVRELIEMCEDFCFYLKLAKPIGANLGRRISDEMADLGMNFKRRIFKTLAPRFNQTSGSNEIPEDIPEVPESEDSKPHVFSSQQQRPLPLPPVQKSPDVTLMPWYKNVDRKGGEELVKNGVDGYFLVRPSSKGESCLTLTLWFHRRPYNIPIRKRRDGLFALGTPKLNEQSFTTVEQMVKNYQSEKLVLYSNGVKTGRTLLTSYPP